MKLPNKISKLFFLALVLLNTQCKKNELDFNKYNNGISPEILTPLATTQVKAWEILKQSDIIKYDPDGLIHLKFKQDSVFLLTADSILKDIHLKPSTVKYSMGEISVPNINESSDITIFSLFPSTDPTTIAVFRAKHGTNDIFPAMTSTSTTPTNLAQNTNYENLKISKGFLKFSIVNNLPTTINEIQIKIIDNLPTPHDLGFVKIMNIAAGTTGSDSINLAGKTLSNNLSYVMPVTDVAQSANPVMIDTTDNIQFLVTANNMRCTGGRAIIPAQNIGTQSLVLDLSDPSNDARLRNILFGSANVPVTTESKFSNDVTLSVDFPDATKSSIPLAPININAIAKNTVNNNIDFSNANLFLGADVSKNYNILRANVATNIKASTGMVDFDSSDYIKITIDPANAQFAYLDGYLGSKTFNIDINDLDVSQLAELGKGIKIENPMMNVYVDNSFGVPIMVKLDISSLDKNNQTLPMNVDTMKFPFPTIAEKGQMKSQTFPINKSNSNIVNCLGMPATKFNIVGKAVMNPNGFKGYTDHIVNTSSINVGFDADIPMTFTAKDFELTDSIDVNESLQGKTDFAFLELKIKTINGFPMGGTIDLIFADQNYVKIDSLKDVTLLLSGEPDANGRVIKSTENMSSILLNRAQLIKLNDQKCKYILIKTKFNTYNSGNTPVSIYTDCKLDISIAFRGKTV